MKIIEAGSDLRCLTSADAEVASTAYPIRVIHVARQKVRMLRAMSTISDCERWKSLGYEQGKTDHIGFILIFDRWYLKFQHDNREGEDILTLLKMGRKDDDQEC